MVLTIGMIVKNEEAVLEECLIALKPVLESLESELIIADTGSTDGTLDIVKKYTDNYFEIEWRNDFAWARNQVMERAKGEWHMQIDADEVLQNPEAIIEFFNSGRYKDYKTGRVKNVNRGHKHSFQYLRRLVKLNKDVRYVYKIHEALPDLRPIIDLDAILYHSGYDFTIEGGKEIQKKKMERNLAPLLEQFNKYPKDLRLVSLLIDQYSAMGEWDKLREIIEHGIKTVPISPYFEAKKKKMFIKLFCYQKAQYYGRSGNYNGLIDYVNELLEKQTSAHITHYMMRERQGDVCVNLERFEEAAMYYEKALPILEQLKGKEVDDYVDDYVQVPIIGEQLRLGVLSNTIINYTKAYRFDKVAQLALNEDIMDVKKLAAGELELIVFNVEKNHDLSNDKKTKLFESYVKVKYDYMMNVCNEKDLSDENVGTMEVLERAVYWANKAYECKKNGSTEGFVSYLTTTLEVCMPLGEIITAVFEDFKTASNPQEAMQSQLNDLKITIYALIDKGETNQAANFLLQYAKINPADPEIQIMKEKIRGQM